MNYLWFLGEKKKFGGEKFKEKYKYLLEGKTWRNTIIIKFPRET